MGDVLARLSWSVHAFLMLAGAWVRVSMSYRTSFAIMVVAQFAVTGMDFVAILIMFASIDALGGFSLAEIGFLYGGSGLCLGLADLAIGNIDRLGTRIRLGTFDAMMTRPVPVFAQVCADQFALRRIGRLVQASVVLAWSVAALDLAWSPTKALMIGYLVVSGTVIFAAFFALGGALQFFTTDAAEVANAFTYGGNTLAQYPLTIYPTEVVKALSFLVPVAFVNWYPSLFILGRPDPFGLPTALQFASPVAALVTGAAAALAWRAGVKHYRSTGS